MDDKRVLFVTVKMPGGSNDGDPASAPWTAPFTNQDAQLKEMQQRNAADIAWLEAAFAEARDSRVRAVVVALQADFWDPEKPGALDKYTPFVQKLADLSVEFGRPVLLINGGTLTYLLSVGPATCRPEQRDGLDPPHAASPEPEARCRPGLDQRSGGMAAHHHRSTQARSLQLVERQLLRASVFEQLRLTVDRGRSAPMAGADLTSTAGRETS